MKTTQVDILGKTFYLKSEADETHISEVAEFVKQKLETVQKSQTMDIISTVILTALNIADDYIQLKNERESLVNSIESRSLRLTSVIDPWLGQGRVPEEIDDREDGLD